MWCIRTDPHCTVLFFCFCFCCFFVLLSHLIQVTKSLIICQWVLSVKLECLTGCTVRLCLNSSNGAKFPAQGHARYYTAATSLLFVWHLRFLQDYCATVNESYSSFSCLVAWGFVSSGLLNHWRGHTLEKKHAASSCWFAFMPRKKEKTGWLGKKKGRREVKSRDMYWMLVEMGISTSLVLKTTVHPFLE